MVALCNSSTLITHPFHCRIALVRCKHMKAYESHSMIQVLNCNTHQQTKMCSTCLRRVDADTFAKQKSSCMSETIGCRYISDICSRDRLVAWLKGGRERAIRRPQLLGTSDACEEPPIAASEAGPRRAKRGVRAPETSDKTY